MWVLGVFQRPHPPSTVNVYVAHEVQNSSETLPFRALWLCLAKTESAFEINKIQRGRVRCYPSYARGQNEAMKRAIRQCAGEGFILWEPEGQESVGLLPGISEILQPD